MNQIIFNSISGRNFQSLGEFSLPILKGRHAVLGPNGSGKSSTFESLVYNIFKKSFRDKDVSRDEAGDCLTSSDITINGQNYLIDRFYKDKSEGNNLAIKVDNNEIGHRKTGSNEDEIERLIPISPDLFVSTVVVLQGLPVNFNSLTPTLRKSILEDMLGFSLWQSYRDKFTAQLRELNLSRTTAFKEYTNSRESMISLNTKIELLEKIQLENNTLIMDEIAVHKKELSGLFQEQEKINTSLSTILDGRIPNVMSNEIHSLVMNINKFNERLRNLNITLEHGTCTECEEKYPIRKIDGLNDEIIYLGDKIPALTQKHTDLLNSYNSYVDANNLLAPIDRNISDCKNRIQSLLNKMNTSSESIPDLKESLSSILYSVNESHSKLSELDKSIENIKYFDGLLLPSSKFRTSLLEKYLDYINYILRTVVPMITQSMGVKIVVDTKFTGVEIEIEKAGRTVSYRKLSGGERKRIDICIILAFQRFLMDHSGLSTNILVFDEIFDALDAEGIDAVLYAIECVFPESSSVFVISHNNSIKSRFSSVIDVIKENDVSRLDLSSYMVN